MGRAVCMSAGKGTTLPHKRRTRGPHVNAQEWGVQRKCTNVPHPPSFRTIVCLPPPITIAPTVCERGKLGPQASQRGVHQSSPCFHSWPCDFRDQGSDLSISDAF